MRIALPTLSVTKGQLTSGMLFDTMYIIDDHMRPNYAVQF